MSSSKLFSGVQTQLLRTAVLCAIALGVTACDGILDENPPHIIVADNLYTDLAGFEAGLNGLYAQVRRERSGASGLNILMNEMMTVGVDNAWGNYPAGTERIFNDWGIRNNPLESTLYLDVWSWLYATINGANTIVTRAQNPQVRWSEADKNRVVAEARLIRAWAYRHLTYLWGDVPLNLEESSGESVKTDWERTPMAEVRAQMEEDLLFAEEHLPVIGSNSGKLNKAVAQHYLAELYLAMGQPAQAETKALAVINSGQYGLITARYGVRASQPGIPFMDQFMDGNVNRSQGNTEVLWALQHQLNTVGGGENIMRRYWVNRYYNIRGVQVSEEYGGRGIGRLSPTAWAINLYEPQDDRGSNFAIRKFYLYNNPANLPAGKNIGDTIKLSWTTERLNNATWPSTRKWDWVDPLNVSVAGQYGDQPYLRLADTYLLLAEAYFKQGKLGLAADALNTVRARAKASPITAAQVTLDFILDERSRELLTEEHRRYTLVRNGVWLSRTQAHNPLAALGAAARDTVFPIPQAVIDANLNRPMRQNPGY